MGQFDSPTEAAIARLKGEDLSKSPVGNVSEKALNLSGILLEMVGFSGASKVTGLLSALKKLAVNKDEANLSYIAEAILDDLKCLYRMNEEMKNKVEDVLSSERLDPIVANAILHATRTNIETRLKRLAHIIAHGVKEDDLEPESLDDMMRAAVELTEGDIVLLKAIYEKQIGLLRTGAYLSAEWSQQVSANWSMHFNHLDSPEFLHVRSSLARLQSLGLVAPVETMMSRNGSIAHQPFGMVLEGKKFYERLQGVATDERQAR